MSRNRICLHSVRRSTVQCTPGMWTAPPQGQIKIPTLPSLEKSWTHISSKIKRISEISDCCRSFRLLLIFQIVVDLIKRTVPGLLLPGPRQFFCFCCRCSQLFNSFTTYGIKHIKNPCTHRERHTGLPQHRKADLIF